MLIYWDTRLKLRVGKLPGLGLIAQYFNSRSILIALIITLMILQ